MADIPVIPWAQVKDFDTYRRVFHGGALPSEALLAEYQAAKQAYYDDRTDRIAATRAARRVPGGVPRGGQALQERRLARLERDLAKAVQHLTDLAAAIEELSVAVRGEPPAAP